MEKLNNKSILIIDDDPDLLQITGEYLKKLGMTVFIAEDGQTGLTLFRLHKPDAVLLDLVLPDIDGLSILKTMSAENPTVPIVMLSGQASKADVITALKLGAWEYLDKPLPELANLKEAIGRVLERAQLLMEKEAYQASLEQVVEQKSIDLESRNSELQAAHKRFEMEKKKRRLAEMAIENEKNFMRAVIDRLGVPARIVLADFSIFLMNKEAAAFLPSHLLSQEDLTCHMAYRETDTPCDGENHQCVLKKVQESGQKASCTHKELLENGQEKTIILEATPLWNDDGSLYGILETLQDLTEGVDYEIRLREHQERLYFMAHHDALTNLPNRMLFQDRLQTMMHKAKRSRYNLGVLFLDLDRFQKINETLGHEIGDKLLCEVSKRLESCLRKNDTVARLGGDEFAIILDELKELKFAAVVARKIHNVLMKPVFIDDYELYTTTSIGIAIFPDDSETVEGLMQCADTALFNAKQSGKNKYQYFTADMNAKAFEFLLMESGLRKAIENDELVVFYQPQFDVKTKQLVGMEALLRWNHPERGIVPPDSFIPLAEETGLIDSLGEWVLRKACEQNKAWQEAGYPFITVAINISAHQFRQRNLVEVVAKVLDETGLNPKYMGLELTESIVMQDLEKTMATLVKLRDMGIKLAVDDFGTGYSSLNYLKMFPIDFLKIDKSFVSNIANDKADHAIATSIIALAHNMDLKVIAEGVENEEQLELLDNETCDFVQGYFFSPPVAPEEVERFFKNNS